MSGTLRARARVASAPAPSGSRRIGAIHAFECAIHAVGLSCEHCGCRIIGHGVQAGETVYCCAHCAQQGGHDELRDRAD